MDYIKEIAKRINEHIAIDIIEAEVLIQIPPRSEMGDFAFPCYQLSKYIRKSPNIIAAELKNTITTDGFEKIENRGPYINFFIDKTIYVKNTIQKILEEREVYGSSRAGEGKTVVLEYSSPNTVKAFQVDHLLSTVIGNSLYNILSFAGYHCIRVNNFGDWSPRFGKLIAAYKKGWTREEELEKNPMSEILRIYMHFNDKAEYCPVYEEEAKNNFKRLEKNCEEEVQLWKRFKVLSLKEFNKIYEMLNVEFDSYACESFCNDNIDAVIEEIDKKGLLVEYNNAKVVLLEEYNMPPCIIKKADDTGEYAAKHLASAIYKREVYDFNKNLYIIGAVKTLSFKQVFTTLKLMGYQWAEDCLHLGFGNVKFVDKKLSTRKEEAGFLIDLLNEAKEKALEIIGERVVDNREDVARKIGIGAIMFLFLKNNKKHDIVFDWDNMLKHDEETGLFVQYVYANGTSVLKKASDTHNDVDYSILINKEEYELVKLIGKFGNVISESIDKYEPSVVTRYIIEVAKSFSHFCSLYNIFDIKDEEINIARIKVVEAACQVMRNGLKLLGLEVVEKM